MKRTWLFLSGLLAVLLLAAACGSPKIYTDYDETKDFKTYQSFNFYEGIKSGLDTLDQKRLQRALVKNLEEKGFSRSKHPDFLINYYADFTKETNHNSLGISIGAIGSPVGGNIASGIPITNNRKIMNVTIELTDAQESTLYWQGVAEVRLKHNRTPEDRTRLFTPIAEKTLREYPPK